MIIGYLSFAFLGEFPGVWPGGSFFCVGGRDERTVCQRGGCMVGKRQIKQCIEK